jgi:alginate O-acetyltransferase complex protein AlgJ
MKTSSPKFIRGLIAVLLIVVCCALVYGYANLEKIKTYYVKTVIGRILNRADEANNGYVIPGRNGWLFYREELRYLLLQWTRLNNDRPIVELSRYLKARGIDLIVVPVPAPLEIYPEQLTGIGINDMCKQRTRTIAQLQESGVCCIDLLGDYQAAKKERQIYFKTDTHLADGGNDVAALRIFRMIQSIDPTTVSNPTPYHLQDTVLKNYEGDLAKKFHGKTQQYLTDIDIRMVRDESGAPYEDCTSSDIILFGDSFVSTHRAYSAHLSALVGKLLGKPIAMVSQVGGITQSPRQIRRLVENKQSSTKIVVWVFTGRSLLEKIEP